MFKGWPFLRVVELLGAGLCSGISVLVPTTAPFLAPAAAFLTGRAFPRTVTVKPDAAAPVKV